MRGLFNCILLLLACVHSFMVGWNFVLVFVLTSWWTVFLFHIFQGTLEVYKSCKNRGCPKSDVLVTAFITLAAVLILFLWLYYLVFYAVPA